MKKGTLRFKKIRKRVAFIALLLALLPLGTQDYMAITEDDVKQAEDNLNAAKEREAEIERELGELSADISDVKSYISEVDGMLESVVLRIYELDTQIADKQAEIDDKQMKIDETAAEIEGVRKNIAQMKTELADAQETEALQYEAMKLRIQYMYENGDDTFIDMLFSSDSMIDFLNNVEYISEISKYDREKLTEYADTKDRVATLLANLEGQESELVIKEDNYEKEKEELDAQQEALYAMRAEQEVQMGSYNNIISAKNTELNNLQSQQSDTEQQKYLAQLEVEEQQQLLDDAKREYAQWLEEQARLNQDADALVKAKLAEINITGFTWPLPGYNTITSQFGMRMHPVLGYEKLHDGVDISGASVDRKPIVAAYSGTVVLAKEYWGYGNCIKIDHGGGVQTLYAHASTLLVSEGDYVNAGDTIALVGMTGVATGPHLHFSLIIKGEFVNPLEYISVPKY